VGSGTAQWVGNGYSFSFTGDVVGSASPSPFTTIPALGTVIKALSIERRNHRTTSSGVHLLTLVTSWAPTAASRQVPRISAAYRVGNLSMQARWL
jgi:hypothetical protein